MTCLYVVSCLESIGRPDGLRLYAGMTSESLNIVRCSSRSATAVSVAAACLAFAVQALPAPAAAEAAHSWHPWFEIGGYYNSRDDDGRGSFGTSRGETTLFAPITGSEKHLLFSQLTAKFFDEDAREGNLAFGYRRMMSPGYILGGWLGADARHTEIGNTFWQMSGGLEVLSKNIDARFNWYGPITDSKLTNADVAQAQIEGDQIYIVGSREVGLKGVDGEIGFRLPTEYAGLDENLFELRAYGGGFYFDDSEALDEIAGVKARLELRVNDVIEQLPGSQLTAEYEISHDDVRDTRHEVGLRLRIPLSSGSSTVPLRQRTALQRRMLDAIERDTDIVTTISGPEAVEDALTGVDLQRVAYATPGQDVTATSAAAGGNSLIVLNGTVVGGQAIGGNRTLVGGGTTFSVRGLQSGLVVPVTAPGAAGRLTSPAINVDNLFLNGSNTHVAGLRIIGGGPAGFGDGVDTQSGQRNIFLADLSISDIGGDGIDIDDRTVVTIMNSTIVRTDENGIDINDFNRVSISGVNIRATTGDGIQINDGNVVSIDGATIRNAFNDGINIDDGNDVTVSNSFIRGTFDDGIEVDNGNRLRVLNSTISRTFFGVFAQGDANSITLKNSTFSNLFLVGLLNQGDGNRFLIDSSLFQNIGSDVFAFDQLGSATLQVSNTTIAGNVGFDVFFFNSGTTNVLAGSDGNVNAANIGGFLCTAFPGSFTGSISFIDGTTLTDNVAPCN